MFQALCLILPPLSVLSSNALVPLLLLAALLLGLKDGSGAGRLFVRSQGVSLLFALLLLWAALASVWSFEPLKAFELVVRLAVLVGAGLVFFGVARSHGEIMPARLAPWLMAGVGLGVLVFLVELFLDFPIYRLANQLGAADPVHPSRLNRGATALAMLVWPLAAMWAPRLGRKAWLLPLGLLPVLLVTESLAAQTGFAVGYLAAGICLFAARAARILLVTVVVAGVLAAPLITKGLNIDGMANWDRLPVSLQMRAYIWDFVAERTLERPVIGWGMDASRDIPNFGVEGFRGKPGPIIALHPHNAILQIWLELGGIGVFLCLALLLTVLRKLRSLPEPEEFYGYALFATTLTIACSAYGIWQNQWIATMFLVGALVPLGRSRAPDP